ncbi:MAG TPA: hypothetical protein VFO19_19120 [Vicinamibacterales bacterium]|nr:hypothetical protein [Vicinamibacterales bacterium]
MNEPGAIRRPQRLCSGDMYAAVPRITPGVVAEAVMVGESTILWKSDDFGSAALANPKSSTFAVPSDLTLMLAGFRSRWTMPASCAVSRATATCLAIASAWEIGSGPRAISSAKSSPGTSSITRYDVSPDVPES